MLIEREPECEALGAAVAAARGGAGRVVVVEGPAGVGKTSLLRWTLRTAGELGVRCQAATAHPLESTFAFGVVRQAFGADAAPIVALAPAAGTAAELLPRLHAIYGAWEDLCAEAPLVVAVDDAHWADEPSLAALGYLARRIADLPLAIVVCVRSGEQPTAVAQLAALRDAADTQLRPGDLSPDAAAALIAREMAQPVDPTFAAACHAAAAGNPFYLTQLARSLAAAGVAPVADAASAVAGTAPAAVTRNVVSRLERLASPAPQVARALAVLGDDASVRELAAMTEGDEAAVVKACEQLAAQGICAGGARVRFSHPIVRAAIYDELAPVRRAAEHGRAARVLTAAGAAPERIAVHLLRAPPSGDPRDAQLLLEAAGEAVAKAAPRAAAEYLDRALREEPRGELRVRILHALGRAETAVGAADAPAHLAAALEEAAGSQRAEVGRDLAGALIVRGNAREAFAVATALADDLADEHPEQALMLESAIASGMAASPPDVARAATERLERLAPRLRGDTAVERELLALLGWARVAAHSHPPQECAELVARAVAGGLAVETPADRPAVSMGLVVLLAADRDTQVDLALEQADDTARRRGSLLGFCVVRTIAAHTRFVRGDLRGAEAEAASALPHVADAWPVGAGYTRGILMIALAEQGRLEEAEGLLAGTESVLALDPPPGPLRILLAARGRLRQARGDHELALEDLSRAGATYSTAVQDLWRNAAVRALAALGRPEEADVLLGAGEPERLGRRRAEAAACRERGLLTPGEDGLEWLERSVAALEECDAQLELAESLLALGAARRRYNQRAAAREPLARALDVASRIGAAPIADRARYELRVAGAKPRRDQVTGSAALTAAERRVAEMAALGATNRQIAKTLFVTLKTVEFHLTQIYRKLGVGSRAELATALRRSDGSGRDGRDPG